MSNEERAELASIAASLKAHLEISFDAGTTGIPRGQRNKKVPATPAVELPPETVKPVSMPPETVPIPVSESAVATVRSLPVLEDLVKSCTRCELAKTRTNTVFSRGNPKARLAFVGEAPGADEDAQGIPFVGKAGQLLDKMIGAMGLDGEKDVYVCNIIKCRPPGNRRPSTEEINACIPYLHEQLANVGPKVIVAMGNTSVQALLDTKLGITRLRGQWKLYRGKTLLMPTYHPSYLLRESPIQKLAKQEAWEDLQKVMKELGLPPPAKGTHPPGYRPPPEPAPESTSTPSLAFPPSTKKP
jgi:uracil-DNA glycosylase family 4